MNKESARLASIGKPEESDRKYFFNKWLLTGTSQFRSCSTSFDWQFDPFSFGGSLRLLFWDLFGMADLGDLKTDEKFAITQFTGELLLGLYSIASILVAINMLIAMMTNSYQQVAVSEAFILSTPNWMNDREWVCLKVYFESPWLKIVLIFAKVSKIIIKTNKNLVFQVWLKFLLPESVVMDYPPPVQIPLCYIPVPVSLISSDQLARLQWQGHHFVNITFTISSFLFA